ncbi:MAG: hypothetical protein ACFE91_07530 [Promethearchaeota archaeon]
MKKIANSYTLIVILLINLSGWTAISIFGPLALEIANGLSVGVSIMGIIHSICLVFSGIMSFLWASLEHKYSRS